MTAKGETAVAALVVNMHAYIIGNPVYELLRYVFFLARGLGESEVASSIKEMSEIKNGWYVLAQSVFEKF